jgi:teichuronic acid biosynthesis glycosyltransferase TuaC
MKLHVALYSSLFPTPLEPSRSVFTDQLAKALALKYTVSVVCPTPWFPNVEFLRNFGPGKRFAGLPLKELRDGITIYYPRYPLIPRCPQIIQPWLQRITISRFLKQLHRMQRIDAVNAHWVYPDGIAAANMARQIGVPTLLTALGSDVNVSAEFPGRRRKLASALKAVQGASGVSQALTERLIALGSAPEQTHYIPNGVNRKIFAPPNTEDITINRVALGLNPGRKYLVFVGRLHPVKGLVHLLEALSILLTENRLDFDTLLIGTGEIESELKTSAQARQLDPFVRFIGNVPHTKVREWLSAGDVFCLPSLMEGMPNVVLEALACGLPIVASRVGGIPDIVNESSGILVPPGNAKALASAVAKAMQHPWDRVKIAADSSGPDWSDVANMYAKVIDSMVDANASPAYLRAVTQ